ncbi:hypothetical protein Anapl_10493 [Anas platyrhynchos]|uniref:Uncharacterized protein n=1 Tax=Anas platyrhynchos TaxID=8839 RepID=R0KAX2_ANAPL|nr:hypothetical protein Anapl_10493 [Anas platyrhynchos]
MLWGKATPQRRYEVPWDVVEVTRAQGGMMQVWRGHKHGVTRHGEATSGWGAPSHAPGDGATGAAPPYLVVESVLGFWWQQESIQDPDSRTAQSDLQNPPFVITTLAGVSGVKDGTPALSQLPRATFARVPLTLALPHGAATGGRVATALACSLPRCKLSRAFSDAC